MIASVSRVSASRVLRPIVRGLLIVWAAFWAWFVLSATIGDPQPVPWWIPLAWLSSLGALVVLSWKWPTLGGLVLVAAGIWAASYFDNASARALLATPAIAIGIGCLALGWSTRST